MAIPFLIPAAISIAAEFFPSLATKLGGKRGAEVAQAVVRAATTVAQVGPDATPQEIIAKINANAGAREQLTYDLEQLNFRETELQIEDRQQARAYQLQSGSNRGTYMLIGVSVALALCVVAIMAPKFLGITAPFDNGELTFLATISGALLKMLSDAFAFEFGSSRGSKEKDEQAAQINDAILRIGQERQAADREVIREQQATIQSVVPVAAIAAVTATQATEAAQQTRDFVSQLVSGKLES